MLRAILMPLNQLHETIIPVLYFLLFVASKGNKYQLNNHLNNFTEKPQLFETINTISPPRRYHRIAPGKIHLGNA
jgi:hypothetical protein